MLPTIFSASLPKAARFINCFSYCTQGVCSCESRSDCSWASLSKRTLTSSGQQVPPAQLANKGSFFHADQIAPGFHHSPESFLSHTACWEAPGGAGFGFQTLHQDLPGTCGWGWPPHGCSTYRPAGACLHLTSLQDGHTESWAWRGKKRSICSSRALLACCFQCWIIVFSPEMLLR